MPAFENGGDDVWREESQSRDPLGCAILRRGSLHEELLPSHFRFADQSDQLQIDVGLLLFA
ncbi:hypothetical protein [Sphingobium fuliginis]|uniref:hypothetical protein n=1 Tax=Sphingobium fuliginis (strain ATCC 27551) TaxID=336203 RepID=UPI001430ADE5|nr:hypothetical protein [Sphingobium fuliginis]